MLDRALDHVPGEDGTGRGAPFTPSWRERDVDTERLWADSGAAFLTGGRPAPGRLVRRMCGVVEHLARFDPELRSSFAADGLGVLIERVAHLGFGPAGGGATGADRAGDRAAGGLGRARHGRVGRPVAARRRAAARPRRRWSTEPSAVRRRRQASVPCHGSRPRPPFRDATAETVAEFDLDR